MKNRRRRPPESALAAPGKLFTGALLTLAVLLGVVVDWATGGNDFASGPNLLREWSSGEPSRR